MISSEATQQARDTIRDYVRVTPLVDSPELGAEFGCRVSLKLELFQATGSFKPRGTFNQILGLTDSDRSAGVVAFSGGNFARAVGYAGGVLGIDTVVVMPKNAPESSVGATESYGATVEIRSTIEEVIERVNQLESDGRASLHPFDNSLMMAGNGTMGLEVTEQAADATHVFVSIGGGGFITGVGSALKHANPQVRLIGVETEGSASMHSSLEAGQVVDYRPTSQASTLNAPYVAEDALRFVQAEVEEVVLVTDAEALAAVDQLADTAKIVAELAAGATLAAAKKRSYGPNDHVVLVICGGNLTLSEIQALRSDQLG